MYVKHLELCLDQEVLGICNQGNVGCIDIPIRKTKELRAVTILGGNSLSACVKIIFRIRLISEHGYFT